MRHRRCPAAAVRPLLVALGGLALVTGVAFGATLEVRSQPGVEVYWEGVLLAPTDEQGLLVVEDVPEGPFALELRKAGFEPYATQVQILAGTTRLAHTLTPSASASVAPAPEPAGIADNGGTPPPDAPGFRVAPLGWLGLAAGLALTAYLVLRSRRGPPAVPPEARPPSVRREPARARPAGAASPSGTFLSELRQRERALDPLADVSRSGADDDDDSAVVDVAWKKVE